MGSTPSIGTIDHADNKLLTHCEQFSDTVSTQETGDFNADPAKPVKFPKRIKFRGRIPTIYGKTKAYPAYRVAWSIHGKRQMKAFERFGGKDGA